MLAKLRRTSFFITVAIGSLYHRDLLSAQNSGASAAGPAIGRTASLSAAHQPATKPLTFRDTTVFGAHLQIVDVDLSDPRVYVTVQLAAGYPHNAEPVSTMLARSKPAAAINGAYFSKEDYAPIGDIVICGKQAYNGTFKTALVIDRDRHASIQRHPIDHRVDWSSYETVLACGPALVLDGKIDYESDAANHRDSHVTGRAPRMGVGITHGQHLLLVAAHGSMSFGEWANVMKELGCRDAMNLDSGASRMLYYRGAFLTPGPGRFLTNLLLVYETPPPDRTALAPELRYGSVSTSPPALDEAPPIDMTAVSVRICPESNCRSNPFCPTSVEKRIKRGKVPGPCRLHKPPPGEGR